MCFVQEGGPLHMCYSDDWAVKMSVVTTFFTNMVDVELILQHFAKSQIQIHRQWNFAFTPCDSIIRQADLTL